MPAAQGGLIALVEAWAGHVLMYQILLPTFLDLMPVLPPEFLADRAGMSPGLSKDAVVAGAPQRADSNRSVNGYLRNVIAQSTFCARAVVYIGRRLLLLPVMVIQK